MNSIRKGDSGAAVEDVQERLAMLGLLDESDVSGTFDDVTLVALRKFCEQAGMQASDEVDSKVWSALVDASYHMGDRTLYLRMPYLHGNDVLELQQALGALGFSSGSEDAIFGAHTENALRKFQVNLGLPSDGIAGAYTFAALRNLEHSWAGKEPLHEVRNLGFARAADVLEANALCLYGTCEFTRSVAQRMSNLAIATNPASHIVSADTLSVAPSEDMLLVEVALSAAEDTVPVVDYENEETLQRRLSGAIQAARANKPLRIKVVLPGRSWMDAGEERTAQHFAITLLDALCAVL
ncbi:peptidoglycan-binding protein [Adlercreutzia sp. ZJ304]|uniref:peptidoglycan-binding domain-containing protein n=1 Tax=Adlercreutzia sp. ZJ304 TaxID=2709791 RepID=UPI0013EC3DC4|nr:peptidoglycan-binding protein [Adlercreutzia sp. ZJ304]